MPTEEDPMSTSRFERRCWRLAERAIDAAQRLAWLRTGHNPPGEVLILAEGYRDDEEDPVVFSVSTCKPDDAQRLVDAWRASRDTTHPLRGEWEIRPTVTGR
jgi:hypothetical protein